MSLCKNFLQNCVRLAAFLSLAGTFALAAQAQAVFSTPNNISNTSNDSSSAQIAVDATGNINVVWLDRTTPTFPYSYTAFFSRSSDGGVTFSAPRSISNPGSSAAVVAIAVAPSGNIYILWSDNSPGSYAAFFTRSTDGGATFSAPQIISNPGANASSNGIAVDSGGNIDIVWSDNSPGHYDVFFSSSADGGTSFSHPLNVSNNSLGAGGANMSVDSKGNVYIVWVAQSSFVFAGLTYQGNVVFFSGSSDGGSTFSSPTDATGFQGPRAIIYGYQVTADSMANISVLWQLDPGTGITSAEYSYSNDGGATFQRTELFGGDEFPPSARMTPDSLGGANFVWQNSPGNGSSFVAYVRYVGGARVTGNSWSVAENTPDPQVAVDSSNNVDIFFGSNFTRSTDAGASFSAVQSAPLLPNSIATDSSGNIYFVSADYINGGNNRNIFFSRSVLLVPVTLNPAAVAGGGSSVGTVALNGPAPAGGAVISLSSSDPSVSVPPTVTIAAGATSATFAVTTSAVSAVTNVTISATFNGVTQSSSLTLRLVLNFSNYLPPLLNDGSSLFHSGRTIPVKFQLTAPDGSMVTNAVANIQVLQIQNTPSGTVDQDMGAIASGGSSSGSAFRFDPTSNQYIYNLDTTGYASGTYLLRTTISDGSAHDVQFSIQ